VTKPGSTFESALGWPFNSPSLLVEALTHSTYANENTDAGPPNERLEFLGDAVLNLLAAELLYARFPEHAEGRLTRQRATVVCLDALADMAEALELGAQMRVGGKGEVNRSMLADTFEAVAGAVFLDGGFDAVRICFSGVMNQAIDGAAETIDFKTRLQESCHSKGARAPVYEVVSISGPDHARRFTCTVSIAGEQLGRAEASSKKAAEQTCAKLAFEAMSK